MNNERKVTDSMKVERATSIASTTSNDGIIIELEKAIFAEDKIGIRVAHTGSTNKGKRLYLRQTELKISDKSDISQNIFHDKEVRKAVMDIVNEMMDAIKQDMEYVRLNDN